MSILNNSKTDPNKILPMKYAWAWQHFLDGINNNWTVGEIPFQDDYEQWVSKDKLTEDERRIILYNLGFFSTAESLTANNIVLAVYSHVTNPEARCYLLRQAFEEAVHTQLFVYCCDTLGLDPDEIYNMYKTVPSIKEKDDFVISITKSVMDPTFKVDSTENLTKFLYDLIGYYGILEGVMFYSGFSMMLGLKRQQKMVALGQQFDYLRRDEALHLSFGANLIKTIINENPEVWTKKLKTDVTNSFRKAVELEHKYVYDVCPRGVVGLTPRQICEYVEYIADKRLERFGLKIIYKTKNPFPWIAEAENSKEANFFEKKVTEYQQGNSLEW